MRSRRGRRAVRVRRALRSTRHDRRRRIFSSRTGHRSPRAPPWRLLGARPRAGHQCRRSGPDRRDGLMTGHPFVFTAAGGDCLGWFHRAEGPRRNVAVVMCRPLAYEALCSYRTYSQLAHTLAAAGCDVVRFDYHGTGDSAGSDADPDRVAAWIETITAAMAEARNMSGAREIAQFGVRI